LSVFAASKHHIMSAEHVKWKFVGFPAEPKMPRKIVNIGLRVDYLINPDSILLIFSSFNFNEL
jgi:hypothetical protein